MKGPGQSLRRGGLVVKTGLMTVPYLLRSAEQTFIVELAGFDISSSWKAERHAQCGLFFRWSTRRQFGWSLSSATTAALRQAWRFSLVKFVPSGQIGLVPLGI